MFAVHSNAPFHAVQQKNAPASKVVKAPTSGETLVTLPYSEVSTRKHRSIVLRLLMRISMTILGNGKKRTVDEWIILQKYSKTTLATIG
ncbi:hypothetical protein DXC89_09950 [Prevotella disiens]|uniref:Uncharacterized protein n=2 Tax=Prevotella disiens TaxID=28130 RepID=A0A3E4QFK8_9BACT|nr:hypothetical protein DXC89_09950 [Prevotella disiens]